MTDEPTGHAHRSAVRFLSTLMVLVGIALITRTLLGGGGLLSTGLIVGLLFIAAGSGRIWITFRGESNDRA
jgi:hypothetical protein